MKPILWYRDREDYTKIQHVRPAIVPKWTFNPRMHFLGLGEASGTRARPVAVRHEPTLTPRAGDSYSIDSALSVPRMNNPYYPLTRYEVAGQNEASSKWVVRNVSFHFTNPYTPRTVRTVHELGYSPVQLMCAYVTSNIVYRESAYYFLVECRTLRDGNWRFKDSET